MKRFGPLLVAVAVSAVAQEPPAIDRTDPKAVAQAYVKACQEGNVEAALALLGGDEEVRRPLRVLLTYWSGMFGDEQGLTWVGWFREFLCIPTPGGFPVTRELKAATVEGDTAQVVFDVTMALEQKVVLKRDEAGNWAVDLIASAKASGGDKESYIASTLGAMGEAGGEGPAGFAAYASYDALRRLEEGLQEYAKEHDDCLPPAEKWVDEIELYLLDRSAFKSPGAPDLAYGFAMSTEAGGRKYLEIDNDGADVGEDFLVLFEWPGGQRNATATPEQLAQTQSFWPDGSTAYLTAYRDIDVLPKGMTLEQKREAEQNEEAMDEQEGPEVDAYRCEQNLGVLAIAARKYAREHGGLLPPAESWQDDLAPYVLLAMQEGAEDEGQEETDPLHCPAAPDIDFGYAINAAVAGKNALDLTDQDTLILFFESNLNTPNAAGDPERDKCDPPRHHWLSEDRNINQVVYLTGSSGYDGLPEGFPQGIMDH